MNIQELSRLIATTKGEYLKERFGISDDIVAEIVENSVKIYESELKFTKKLVDRELFNET